MSSSKPKKKQTQNMKKSSLESQNVEPKSQHEVLDDGSGATVSLKKSLSSKERHLHFGPRNEKKNFRIPRKNEQDKELLQALHFDSREATDLLRHVNLSFRYQNSASMFRFEKVEFVNNEKLRQKYADKKQEMRLECQKTREIEEKFGFLYTNSRTKVKDICERGLQTVHSHLTFLGDPNLGVYLCRYADVVYKRPLNEKDKGYLIVFNMIKGRIKGISGGNPEQQPTPHHDCHVSKLFMNLTSSASHTEVYGTSMFYFYEIDENSEDFHSKHPRQVLPYAVISFSILKPEAPPIRSMNDKSEASNPTPRDDKNTRLNDVAVSSPTSEDMRNEIITTTSNVSWSGQLFHKNKFIAFINLVSYSKKKLFLPDYVDQKINIFKKISHDQLKTLFKYPIFRNGKPSSTGVSREFGIGGKFIYYEIQPLHNERERFDKLLVYLVQQNSAAVIEYIGGAVHMYIMPTSQLTHDTGITDEKSPVILHALVHVRRVRPYPVNQENQQPVKSSNASLKEESISTRIQEIIKEKLNIMSKPPSLLSIKVKPRKQSDQSRFDTSKKPESKENSDKKRGGEHPSAKSKVHRSEPKNGHDNIGHRASTSTYSSRNNRFKWVNDNKSSLGNLDSKSNLEIKESSLLPEGNDTDKATDDGLQSGDQQQQCENKDKEASTNQSNQESSNTQLHRSSSLDMDVPLDIVTVQKWIETYKKLNNPTTHEVFSGKTSSLIEGPGPEQRSSSSTNVDTSCSKKTESSGVSRKLSIATPPLPPPLPQILSPLVTPILRVSSSVPSTPGTSTKQSSSLSNVLQLSLPTLAGTSKVSQEIDKGVSSGASSLSGWPSPPSIERKSMEIPGFEPPGSPVFNLLKDKQVSSVHPSRKSSTIHPTSPLVNDSKTIAPSPILSPQPLPVAHQKDSTSTLNDVSDKATESLTIDLIQTKPRRITLAEKTSAKAMEKVRSILKLNASPQTNTASTSQNVSPVDINSNGTTGASLGLKSILKKPCEETLKLSSDQRDMPENETLQQDIASDLTVHIKEIQKEVQDSPVKVVSLNEYRNKLKQQSNVEDNTDVSKTNKKNLQSQSNQKLKSGPNSLISSDKNERSSSTVTQTAPSNKPTDLSSSKKHTDSPNEAVTKAMPKKESRMDSGVAKKRKLVITVKSKVPKQTTCGYDDITSDISDDELPDDKITSDISDTELTDDFIESDDKKAEQKKNLRPASRPREPIPSTRHKRQRRDERENRFHERRHQSRCDKPPPHRKSHSPPRSTSRSASRSASRSNSPDDWGWERRGIERKETNYRTDTRENKVCDNISNDSGSAMSISPINSPVSFEYTTDGIYHTAIDSPSRCDTLLGGMSAPRSPTEVARLDSPGTPETAVPSNDFLHANIGYWSTDFTSREDVAAALPYGTMGYLETQVDDSIYETANQDNIPHYDSTSPGEMLRYNDLTHFETANQGNIVQSGGYYDNDDRQEDWTNEPYPAQQDNDKYSSEEPRMDSRGEENSRRRCASIGEGSGYDHSPSYMELRKPFFGTTEDVILYDNNVLTNNNNNNCTEDDYDEKYMDTCTDDEDYDEKYIDAYPNLPTRADDLHDSQQDFYYTSRSPYEDIASPRSVSSFDDDADIQDCYEGRGASITPEPYMDMTYSLDKRMNADDDYGEYENRSASDTEDNRMDGYEREQDSYQNQRSYFSDDELREPLYSKYNEKSRYFTSDDEELVQDALSSIQNVSGYERGYTSNEESVDHSDYNEHDYQYLDDIAKDDIYTTTFEFDRIVCDGFRSFPSHFLRLPQIYTNSNNWSNTNGDIEASSEVQRSDDCNVDTSVSPEVTITGQISKNRDPRLNRDLNKSNYNGAVVDVVSEQTSHEPKVKDTSERKDEKKSQALTRVQSYYYVYEPENDTECKAVRNYMLKTGAKYLDIRDSTKLKTLRGGIRVLIRGKHKSSLHKISNLSKLKCLRNVKFALFNNVEDVVKKTRAYTAIFQYGGVLIPDDFILKRVHPAYLEALLTFMAEENAVHQKVFWVMNVRYQAYKKLGSQRPLTWRDTSVLDLLKKYRDEGFINILQKDYVTEGLSPIQRYLDTAWRQQRDLMATYRHFIMLSNMEKQKSETSWFRNRGIGFMDIKTFLLAFAGEKKTHHLLLNNRCSYDSQNPPGNPNKTFTVNKRTEPLKQMDETRDHGHRRLPISNMVSRSTNYRSDDSIKERRLEILSSIKDVKDNLMNDLGAGLINDISSDGSVAKDMVECEERRKETGLSSDPTYLELSDGLTRKDVGSLQEAHRNAYKDNFNIETSRKGHLRDIGSPTETARIHIDSTNELSRKRLLSPKEMAHKNRGSTKETTRNGVGSPTTITRKELGSSKEITRKRMTSPIDIAHRHQRSPKDTGSTRKRVGSPHKDMGSSKEVRKSIESFKDGRSKETNYKDKDSYNNIDRYDLKSLKCVVDFKDNSRKDTKGQDRSTWSRTVRNVGSTYERNNGYPARIGRGIRGRGYKSRTVLYDRRRNDKERTSNHSPNP